MTPIEIAETRAQNAGDPRLYMLAYAAGWHAALDGWDLDGYARKVGLEGEAGFIEGVAAYRARNATADQYVPGSPAHINHVRGNRNA